ncbi:DNA integrity scanning protein DisA nucleotide-binding domain protein [Bacillus sp. AFS051223]|uniref:DNA integrity scanning protein DisA nucleotide-binding domain protein n=1 Tax=Bacillus sp. AFS051223 TaxID=2034280 RepID=UPI00359C40AE
MHWSEAWNEVTYAEIGRRAAASSDPTLYQIINDLHIISSTPYEGADCNGHMLIDTKEPDIRLVDNVHISTHKRVRKLLETTKEGLILLVHPTTLEAYGFKINENNRFKGDLYIRFKGRFSWDCTKNGRPSFYFDKMQAHLPLEHNENINQFELNLKEIFPGLADISLLNSLVLAAKKQKHGTMLVILDEENAKSEANRLRQSSTLITPKIMNPTLLMSLSEIDGAIILDTKGVCYSFGVILDGSVVKGDPGRGARYNSALRYLELHKLNNKNCLIFIVSEDGYTTIEYNQV